MDMGPLEARVLERLKDGGHRLTAPRLAVIQILNDAESWLSPDQVRQRAAERCPGLGLVTVYRTLGLLTELGLVRRIHWEDGCHGFAMAETGHRHHLVCQRCRRVVEFPGCDLGPMLQSLETDTGFAVETHMLEVVGLCPECQRLSQ
jgi:Fur family transcriptional regulator, ferric uptake regulator